MSEEELRYLLDQQLRERGFTVYRYPFIDLLVEISGIYFVIEIKKGKGKGWAIGQALEYKVALHFKLEIPLEKIKILIIGNAKSKYFDKVIEIYKLTDSVFFANYNDFNKICHILNNY